MAVAVNFSGADAAESAAITVGSGNMARVRFEALAGSALVRMKVVSGGSTTLVDIDETDLWDSPARAGDVVCLVYNGQGNPASKAIGILEEVPAGAAGGGGDANAANQVSANTLTGGLTEAAPASDTASSGLNGRLQRIAQRLTSLISLFPTSIGQKLASTSLAMVLASDQPALATNVAGPMLLSQPSSVTISAISNVQWQVEGGMPFYLTLTNAPGATAAWVATHAFQVQVDGGAWASVSAVPVGAPNAVNVTGATANGLWLINMPTGNVVNFRVNCTAYTSGTTYALLTPQGSNNMVPLPWTYSVTSGQTLCGPIDVADFSEVSLQLSAVTGTTVTAQGTNDSSLTTWDTISLQDRQAVIPIANYNATFRAQTGGYRWFRLQITGSGSVLTVQGISARRGPAIGLNASGSSIFVDTLRSANLGVPSIIGDVSSAALTTTTTTATITPTFGCSYEVNIPVTAVSGTSPTLDVVVQESDDGSTNWFDVYHFPRITATGMYRSPKLPLTGNRVRYVQTVGGASPSFTRAINRLQSSDTAQPYRRLFDRSLNSAQALNAVTASLLTGNGTKNVQMVISAATVGTAPVLRLRGSDDNGASYYDLPGGSLTAVNNSTVQVTLANVTADLVQAFVGTAGAGTTLNYVEIKVF